MRERALRSSGQTSESREQLLTGAVWIPRVARHLSESLVDPGALVRLGSCAARLAATVLQAIEVRLAPGASRVDLSGRLINMREARQAEDAIRSPVLRRFLRRWSERSDPRIPFIWFEFDLDEGSEPGRVEPIAVLRIKGIPEPSWFTGQLIPALCGKPSGRAQRLCLEHSLEAARQPGKVGYFSELAARGSQAVRLDFFNYRPPEMIAHLRRIGRKDLAADIASAAEILAPAERFQMSYDIADEVLSRVGVEGSFHGWPGGDPRWQSLLDRLVAEGLCCPAKRDAVLAWSGYDSISATGDLPGVAGFLVRRLSHVKLVCRPQQPPEAKAYLLLGHYVRDASGSLRFVGAHETPHAES